MQEAESPPTSLTGGELAFTGQLASMSRAEAEAALTEVGARHVAAPGPGTNFLVVGQGGAPLGQDGRLTAALRRAREMMAAGHPIRLLREEAFLAALGRHDRLDDLRRLYTSEQLGRILGVPTGRVRQWVRQGLIRPARVVKRLCFFDFAQVSAARELARLAATGVSPTRLRRSLEQLASWLGADALPGAQLEGLERGALIVRLPDGSLAESSGQLRLDFAAPPAAAGALPLHAATPHDPGRTQADAGAAGAAQGAAADETAEQAFERGLDAEDRGDLDAAIAAYRRASAAPDGPEEAAFNLGNCLAALGRHAEAVDAYLQATARDAEYVEAWNNLGISYGELDRHAAAEGALRRALALAPSYADAHYNLAEVLVAAGRRSLAREHWQAYLRQDPNSSWAEAVRARLAEE